MNNCFLTNFITTTKSESETHFIYFVDLTNLKRRIYISRSFLSSPIHVCETSVSLNKFRTILAYFLQIRLNKFLRTYLQFRMVEASLKESQKLRFTFSEQLHSHVSLAQGKFIKLCITMQTQFTFTFLQIQICIAPDSK